MRHAITSTCLFCALEVAISTLKRAPPDSPITFANRFLIGQTRQIAPLLRFFLCTLASGRVFAEDAGPQSV